MDFGHLPETSDPKILDHLRFELPADDPRNSLRNSLPGKRIADPRVSIGAPVWSHPGWVGTLYPLKTPSREFLAHYSRQFNSIELNSTFYRIPDARTLRSWREMTPADFRFAPKLHQGISHASGSGEFLRDFCEKMSELGDRLGMSFLQLPPSFSRNRLPSLHALLRHVPKGYRLAVEFRHPSWLSEGALSPDAFDALAELGISAVITDTVGRRDVLHASVTSPRAMIRFLGNELHPSDFSRIDSWVEKIAGWIENGLEEICCFVHQKGYDFVAELAADFAEKLNRRCALAIRKPHPLDEPPEDAQLKLL